MATLLTMTSAAPAMAGAVEDCEQSVDRDRRIKGCTAIIGGKQSSSVSIAYRNRGIARSDAGDYDRAIADFDRAVRLDSKSAESYFNRGNAWTLKGNHDRAIADYSQAIRLEPKLSIYYLYRIFAWVHKGNYDRIIADASEMVKISPKDEDGYLWWGVGYHRRDDFDRADAAFSQAIKVAPKNFSGYFHRGLVHFDRANFAAASDDFMRAADLGFADAMLWRFFTRARLKQDGSAELSINSTKLKDRDWPLPIIEFYLGKLPLEKLRTAAGASDKACELNFYLAEWHLSRGEDAAAMPLLKAVVAGCPKASIEHGAAVVELERNGI